MGITHFVKIHFVKNNKDDQKISGGSKTPFGILA